MTSDHVSIELLCMLPEKHATKYMWTGCLNVMNQHQASRIYLTCMIMHGSLATESQVQTRPAPESCNKAAIRHLCPICPLTKQLCRASPSFEQLHWQFTTNRIFRSCI